MQIILLGTGTSQGVPVIACPCPVCQSSNPRDKRLRSSIYVEINGIHLVVDTGPDFRQQMLREHITKLDAILFTHQHKDHTAGLDDVRAFNFIQQRPADIFAEARVIDSLRREFSYVFAENKYPGVPELNVHEIHNMPFSVKGEPIIPIRAYHHKLPVLGFRIGDFAYLTDANYLPESEYEKLNDLEVLVVDALRKEKHLSHFNLEEALALIDRHRPRQAYLTHISHLMGFHNDLVNELPAGVAPGHDGLRIRM